MVDRPRRVQCLGEERGAADLHRGEGLEGDVRGLDVDEKQRREDAGELLEVRTAEAAVPRPEVGACGVVGNGRELEGAALGEVGKAYRLSQPDTQNPIGRIRDGT